MKLFSYKGRKCHYCGDRAETKDHILPRSKGGTKAFDNLEPACREGNSAKGNMDYQGFLESSYLKTVKLVKDIFL